MTVRLKIAFSLNLLFSVAAIAFGLRSLFSPQLMPHHLQVIGRSWNELDSRLQMMFLGLLRLGGLGQLSTGITLGLLTLIPFRHGQRWAYWAIPLIGVGYAAPAAYNAYALHHATQAETPWKVIVMLVVVLLGASLLTVKSAGPADAVLGEKKAAARKQTA
jgi:hypothetical protein